MSALTRVQDEFQAFLLKGAAGIELSVIGTARVPIATRLAIYGDAYRLRLIEALEANYPALAKLLGPDDFGALGTSYVLAHESRFRSIRYYGDALANFLDASGEYAQVPVLAELARWEWAMTEAFDAADAGSVDVRSLATVAPDIWGTLRFAFHPSMRRLALFWNVPQMWKALTNDLEDRPQPSVTSQAEPWLLWRQNLQTFYRSLPAPEAEALDAACAGARFGEICIGLAAHFSEEETPVRAAGYLRGWIAAGLITEVKS